MTLIKVIPMKGNYMTITVDDISASKLLTNAKDALSRWDLSIKCSLKVISFGERRTPSPIRNIIDNAKKLKALITESDDLEENKINDFPQALKDIVDKYNYQPVQKTQRIDIPHIKNKEDVDLLLNSLIAPTLLEAVLIFKKNWVFVTQFETYYRNNKSIDSSAIDTLYQSYHEQPKALIRQKEERGRQWIEVL
ncbi:uncharacterized protein BX663DRAFT_511235 [Cokeromyces recurvatus]|uniref:uncharacterized protein n=1 Tax=Cokeromyces recurvatus TaxID=90255 RepID=UPI00221E4AD4|nr:uncharacterized protein BX663DRAFT_511235 [Cokeromyces recurvatus]KAI7902490.1 hypothetical protein BX663DRAFT_511235 [Cokeromyces recurvatus]